MTSAGERLEYATAFFRQISKKGEKFATDGGFFIEAVGFIWTRRNPRLSFSIVDDDDEMSIEDTIGYRNPALNCVVCGKNVENGRGFARIKRGNNTLELCCPLCLETFQKDPAPYLKRLYRVHYFRELAELQGDKFANGDVRAAAS